MTTTFIDDAESRSHEIAEYLRAIAAIPLAFEGPYPLRHSSHNHVHLWKIEYLADTHRWIDIDFRVDAVNYILEQWRRRMKGYPPYRQDGYRFYVYQDLAPTLSVVAQTKYGFPYDSSNAIMVSSIREVMLAYEGISWRSRFTAGDGDVSEKRILEVIAKQSGSISKPSAERLGMSVGELRSLIINRGIGTEVNLIRKQFHRRPAELTRQSDGDTKYRIFERILPANYR